MGWLVFFAPFPLANADGGSIPDAQAFLRDINLEASRFLALSSSYLSFFLPLLSSVGFNIRRQGGGWTYSR